jgi:hypothetical protein
MSNHDDIELRYDSPMYFIAKPAGAACNLRCSYCYYLEKSRLLNSPSQMVYWEFEETDQVAVRMGDWKMVSKGGIPHLYNLANDLHEDYDLAQEYPDIVRQMVEIAHSQHTENSHFKVTMPRIE